jgi:hypothetical protein
VLGTEDYCLQGEMYRMDNRERRWVIEDVHEKY